MSEPDQEHVVVPKGDPVHSVWIWRQDSILLARMRPALEELINLNPLCEREIIVTDEACFEVGYMPVEEWCFPCRVRRVQLMLHLAANTRGAA